MCLVTGSLWGRPMWGTYWVWDARLTSVLVLFLLYLGVIALWRTVEDPSRAARAVAILTLVGAVDLPIIKFSVDWWNTLHQGASVLSASAAPTIDPSILIPLFIMAARSRCCLHHAAARRHAQRNPAPPGADAAADAGERRELNMEATETTLCSSSPLMPPPSRSSAADRLGDARLPRAIGKARRSREKARAPFAAPVAPLRFRNRPQSQAKEREA
jgi:hypothetical protein